MYEDMNELWEQRYIDNEIESLETHKFVERKLNNNPNVENVASIFDDDSVEFSMEKLRKTNPDSSKVVGYVHKEMDGNYNVELFRDVELDENGIVGFTWNYKNDYTGRLKHEIYPRTNDVFFFTTNVDGKLIEENNNYRENIKTILGDFVQELNDFRKDTFGFEANYIKTSRNG